MYSETAVTVAAASRLKRASPVTSDGLSSAKANKKPVIIHATGASAFIALSYAACFERRAMVASLP